MQNWRAPHRRLAPFWVEIRVGRVKYQTEGRPENQNRRFPLRKSAV